MSQNVHNPGSICKPHQDPPKKGGRNARPTKATRKKRKTHQGEDEETQDTGGSGGSTYALFLSFLCWLALSLTSPAFVATANCVITNGELTSISIDPPQGCGWDWEVATPGFGFMPTIEHAHSLKLLVGNKLLTFTPQPGSSSPQLLCRFTWNRTCHTEFFLSSCLSLNRVC
jgi:hypothetical protein